jgi:AcrR family transcriptional regulator
VIKLEHRRRTGAETRAAVLDAAAAEFRRQGYTATTLEKVADDVGITRAAVLHHFGSKDQILVEIALPLMSALDELFDSQDADAPLGARPRRAFVRAFVDLLSTHRSVVAILGRDMSAQEHLPPEHRLDARAARFIQLVVGSAPDPLDHVHALSALGAIVRPISTAQDLIDCDDPAVRQAIAAAALRALRAPPR